MRAYISVLLEIIDKQLDLNQKFNLIRMQDFISPDIYLEVCNYYIKKCEENNIQFIGKLSKEKYQEWSQKKAYTLFINQLDKKNLIEKEENLTKWRNYSFTNKTKNALIILMGTESVEDKGGLEEFYNVNSKTIDNYIGKNYSILLKKTGFAYETDEFDIINEIIATLFKDVPQDLNKLSLLIDKFERNMNMVDLVSDFCSCLYEYWKIPNILNISLSKDLNRKKLLDKIKQAYKFSKRISLDYNSQNKIDKLSEKIDKYYEDNKKDIENNFDANFGGYATYKEFKDDLIKYVKGLELASVKSRLFKVDFNIINAIVKIKIKTGVETDKIKSIKGDPFKALFLPILLELSNVERQPIANVNIIINSVKLVGVNNSAKDFTALESKWNCCCRFLNGINKLINKLYLENSDGEQICVDIYSIVENDHKLNTFDSCNTKELIDFGTLSKGSNNNSHSKLNFRIEFCDSDSKCVYETEEYQWSFSDYDPFLNIFAVFSHPEFDMLLKNNRAIPVVMADVVNDILDCSNEEEIYYCINNKSFNYQNIFDEILKDSDLAASLKELGEKFILSMNSIKNTGFFNAVYENETVSSFLTEYDSACKSIKSKIQHGKISSDSVNIFSKLFLLMNTKGIHEKNITGAVVPPYHPIMIERLVEHYRYLSNAFKEIYDELINSENLCSIKSKAISDRFERFIQLSTVTSSIDFLIGNDNNYILNNNTIGYYSLFGKQSSACLSSNSLTVNFDDEDDEDVSMTESTPVSDNVYKIIVDFIRTYPSKIDGLRIAFYKPHKYKDIIIGINKVVKELKNIEKITINLDIYTDDYRGRAEKYFKYWIDNKYDEESGVWIKAKVKYLNADINKTDAYKRYIENNVDRCDLIFIDGIMEYKSVEEEHITYEPDNSIQNSRYPSVYLPLIAPDSVNRKTIISQPQFNCGNSFSQLMIYINNNNSKVGTYRIVKKVQLTDEMEQVINYLNEKCSWAVIIDENIDKKIINRTGNRIISFATGKGYFGELNLSISSKDEYLIDLKNFLLRRLKVKFSNWSIPELEKAVNTCIDYARLMDGSEILKAINPASESINEYLAYLLTSKLLNNNGNDERYVIQKLISADAQSHLFTEQIECSDNSQKLRPDLLLFKVENKYNDELIIDITIIECKIAKEADEHVKKATEQVKASLRRLNRIWGREKQSIQDRYWFNQLYRILVYNNEFDYLQGNSLNNSLYRINDGKFKINLSSVIYTYWLDTQIQNGYKENTIQYEGNEIKHIEIDKNMMKSIILNESIDSKIVDFDTYKTDSESNTDHEYELVGEGDLIDNNKNEVNRTNDTSYIKIDNNENIVKFNDEIVTNNDDILQLFEDAENSTDINEDEYINEQITNIVRQFNIRDIKIYSKGYIKGPDVVRMSFDLGVGVDFNKIEKYRKDIKLWTATNEEPIIFAEDGLIKIDIVRKNREVVSFRRAIEQTLIDNTLMSTKKDNLYVLLGLDILGKPKVINLSDSNNPHLLIAGQTGSGKSVLLSSMLTSMMVYYTPEELELMLVDPKRVELTIFKKSPFTTRTATDAPDVTKILDDIVAEMMNRYKLFEQYEVNDIKEYNKKCINNKLKRIVVVIDEFGILMESDKDFVKNFESSLKKISQLARAAGIHLIICTQTPKAEIITTAIRNNLPARIGLKVTDAVASNLILDSGGCEKLLGKGDMYLKVADSPNPIRCKSPFIKQPEIRRLNEYYMNLKPEGSIG